MTSRARSVQNRLKAIVSSLCICRLAACLSDSSLVYVPPPLAPWYLPVPPVILNVYSLRCEPSSNVSVILSPLLKL